MSKQHILDELKQFIQAVTSRDKLTAMTTTKTSIRLLEELPAAKEVVFEYFALVAEATVHNYVSTANVDTRTGLLNTATQSKTINEANVPLSEEEASFAVIQEALEFLLTRGPSAAWGPVLAAWSLELIGKLSNKYTSRKMTIVATCNYWLNCSAMRGLMTLINTCFRRMNNVEDDICVETMLNAYQKYTTSFDWVVARLGGCFPKKIISQILNCSLKRFAEDLVVTFESEIGILDYLAFAYDNELKETFREMLQDGFQPKRNLDASIVPFLLVLSNYSDILLENLASVFLNMLTMELRAVIIQRSPLWMSNKFFSEMQPTLNNIVLRMKSRGVELLMTVASMAEDYCWCQDFLEFTMQEFEQIILNARTCPLMCDLTTESTKYLLWNRCLSTNIYEQQTATRLLLLISSQHSQIYYQTISELLRKSYITNQNGLGAVIRILDGNSGLLDFPKMKLGLQMVFEDILLQEQFHRAGLLANVSRKDNSTEALNTFKNLHTLLKMQRKNPVSNLKQQALANCLSDCLAKILQILDVTVTKLVLIMDERAAERTAEKFDALKNIKGLENGLSREKKIKCENDDSKHAIRLISEDGKERHRLLLADGIIDIINTVFELSVKTNVMRTTEVLKLSVLAVKYFFISIAQPTTLRRSSSTNRVFEMIRKLCSTRKMSQTVCLRELIEGALFYYGYLFAQSEEPDTADIEIPSNEMVLLQNQRSNLGPGLNRTVLHAGVIGSGIRNAITLDEVCNSEMQSYLLKALDACCMDASKQNIIEGYSTISLLLVELVSTDVMYNGLPFPDEEFSKVTMERDLLIRRAFTTSPILWSLLGYIAKHRPALCFSSVLLRALCATCLHQWRAKNVLRLQAFNPKEELLQSTKKLLQILAVGQLLPPPLSNLHNIIEFFEANEIALLLKECVWNYMKDHVPSPALFQMDANGLHWRNPNLAKVPPQYCDTLRNLMQRKLPKLGAHYHQMFVLPESLETQAIVNAAVKQVATVSVSEALEGVTKMEIE